MIKQTFPPQPRRILKAMRRCLLSKATDYFPPVKMSVNTPNILWACNHLITCMGLKSRKKKMCVYIHIYIYKHIFIFNISIHTNIRALPKMTSTSTYAVCPRLIVHRRRSNSKDFYRCVRAGTDGRLLEQENEK